MPDNELLEMYKQHTMGQNKYTYFLLAVAASAIAFSVGKTSGRIISWSMLPLGVAVILWAVSFYCGCKIINFIQLLFQSNYYVLQLKMGVHSNQLKDKLTLDAEINKVESTIKSNIMKAAFFNDWQFRLLILGAVCFVAWHIFEMAIRTCKI